MLLRTKQYILFARLGVTEIHIAFTQVLLFSTISKKHSTGGIQETFNLKVNDDADVDTSSLRDPIVTQKASMCRARYVPGSEGGIRPPLSDLTHTVNRMRVEKGQCSDLLEPLGADYDWFR